MAQFEEALEALRGGRKVHRTGWNGRGMWVELQTPDEHSKMTLPYMFLSYSDGKRVPWVPSQTDVLAYDWALLIDDSPLLPYQQRVIDEKRDLDIKRASLDLFIGTPVFKSLDEAEQERMHTQAQFMAGYSNTLRERIAAFD